MKLSHQIQSLLFHFAEPMSTAKLSRMLKVDTREIEQAISELRTELEGTGIALLTHDNEVELVTPREASDLILALTKEELSRELSKTALETLSIVLYKGPITRSEIDFIRGVNSTFILRNLLIRGLVEKMDNPNDQRSFLYRATSDLMKQLGVTQTSELPRYEEIQEQLHAFEATHSQEAGSDATPHQQEGGDRTPFGSSVEAELEHENALAIEEEILADQADLNDIGKTYDDAELHDEMNQHGNPQ